MVMGREDKWATWDRVVSFGHKSTSLGCWKDIIAVGLKSGVIMILDAITGSTSSVLSGHTKRVKTLVFSTDGKLLVSGSEDCGIKLWDIQTGGVVKTFSCLASSVSISPDATTVASCSAQDVRLWDIKVGECRRAIDVVPTPGGVTCLNFLPAFPGRLVYVSGGSVQQWDIDGNETGSVTPGNHIAFSSDGKRFVLCANGPPTLRATVLGSVITTLHTPPHYHRDVNRCCFSSSDEFVAGVSKFSVFVWNITGPTPSLIHTFNPSFHIISFSLHSSFISMHSDGNIKFRRIDGGYPDSSTSDIPRGMPVKKRFIYATLQVDERIAISVNSEGKIERWDLSTRLPETLLKIPKIKDTGGTRLHDGILTVAYCGLDVGWNVSAWDVKAGQNLERKPLSDCLSIPGCSSDRDSGISKDGATFFVVDSEEIRTWSISTGEMIGSVIHRDYTRSSTPLSVDLDGPIIWIRSLARSQAWGWDSRNLMSPPLDSSNVPNRLRLAYFKGEQQVPTPQSWIVDTTSKTEVFRLPAWVASRCRTVWDGRYLFAVDDTRTLFILDFVHMALR